jgi:site-specific recombinase XerC
MPADVALYIKDNLGGSPSTQKLHRSAIKRYFDLLVVRHISVINPAASVKTPRLNLRQAKTRGVFLPWGKRYKILRVL